MPPGIFTIAIRLPWEIFALEIIYSLFISGLCLLIYFRTKEIYELSKYKGLFHFRNIFLYFALSYLFRSLMIIIPLTSAIFSFEVPVIFIPISFLLTGYFSTMAILSLAMTIILKDINMDDSFLNIFMHAIAILLSIIVFLTRSHPVLILMQTALFLVSVLYSFIAKKEKSSKLLSQNKVIYALLFLFWVLNILAAGRRVIPQEGDILLYLLSALVFVFIFLRVHKRLTFDGKKKR